MTELSSTDADAATLDLREAARHVMVDFNQMRTFTADPLIMVEGSGIRLTDHEGRRYIDGLSGVFAVSLGHGNDEIIDAIAAQHRRLSFSSPIMTTTDRALELATALIRLTGGRYDVVKQLNSGSEATEAAIKMARQYHRQSGSPERYKTISFYRSYHGATMGALTSTGLAAAADAVRAVRAGRHPRARADPGRCRACSGSCTLGCLAQLRDVIESEGPRTVSAVLVEPVMLTAGVHALPQEYLQGLRALCDETGVLLIFDEIVTGFGRLGSWFAAEQAGVWPDILCVGQGADERVRAALGRAAQRARRRRLLGRGVRGGAVPGRPHVREQPGLGRLRPRGDPLLRGARRARQRPSPAAPSSRRGCGRCRAATRSSATLRGRGLLYCVDFVDPATRGPLASDQPVGTAVQQAARRPRAARARLTAQRDARAAARA